jgi:hypothetical protein
VDTAVNGNEMAISINDNAMPVPIKTKPKRLTAAEKAAIRASAEYQTTLLRGKEFVAQEDSLLAQYKSQVWARLGALVDQLETKYGEGTLQLFAEDLGIAACSLERRRSAYRAFKNISAPAPISYAVAQELQAVPTRAEIIKNNPNITKREARELAQEHRKQKSPAKQTSKKQPPPKDGDVEHAEARFRLLSELITKIIKEAEFADEKGVVDAELRHVISVAITPGLLDHLREGRQALIKVINFLEPLEPRWPPTPTQPEWLKNQHDGTQPIESGGLQ